MSIFARAKPVNIFARATPSPRSVDAAAATTLGPVPVSSFSRLKERQAENMQRQLENLDLDPEIAAEIASIDPDGSYAMTVTLKGYKGSPRAKDATWVGRGRGLWERIAWLAGSDDVEIYDVEFVTLRDFAPSYQGSYALWGKMSVVTADGERFTGLGDYVRWRNKRDAAIGGRPKKRRGRRTYAEGKKAAAAQSQADLRARRSRARLSDLREKARSLEKRGAKGLAAKLRSQARALDKRIKAGHKGRGKRR